MARAFWMRPLIAAIALGCAAQAHATPVYLHCTIDGANQGWDLTWDEAKNTAVSSNNPARTVPAAFSLSEVTFQENVGGVVSITTTINRRTLELYSQALVSGGSANNRHGTCKVVTAEEN